MLFELQWIKKFILIMRVKSELKLSLWMQYNELLWQKTSPHFQNISEK